MNIYSGALAQRITLGKNLVIHASKKFWLRQNRPCVRPPLHVLAGMKFSISSTPRVSEVNRMATQTINIQENFVFSPS